jgi:hypothetical protein
MYRVEGSVFNFSGQALGTDAISISGNWWHLYGLTITNCGHNSVRISGNNNTLERCVSLGARNTGIHISGGQGSGIYPASNLVLNCDSIRSYDAPVGGNADGFSAKWDLGISNVFRGCRAWENSDDGWDLWMGNAPVLIEDCWTWRSAINVWDPTNTQFNGNGNGFKLGGNDVAASHHLVNCVSFLNPHHGYDQNNNAGAQILDNCTAWNNGTTSGHNFNLNHGLVAAHVLRNNLSIAGTVSTNSSTVQISNSWQVVSPAPGTSDVLSTDYAWSMAPRRDDGGLPETHFLRLIPSGRLLDKGTNLGAPFSGTAPDLGAFESVQW